MVSEDWQGTSLLYVSPLKALLNSLEDRLQQYCSMVGRRVALWHGDVSEGRRRRIVGERPDCLLVTPESLEVILVSGRSDKERAFGSVQVVIVDEIHAFAGDDRGWHLLAVLERIDRLARREMQRVGLSATVGNPDSLLDWLAGQCKAPRRVIAPEATIAGAKVTLDHVGSLENAAIVVARLHRGEKRLVFCDSRSQVEALGRKLRQLGVDVYLSHSSLSSEERKRAENAFAAGRDCVIVSTSTLELGIDVGDLDRVVQLEAPSSVSSFLQRVGRSGRRPGSERNCLFLTTTSASFMRAAGIARLWSDGFIEAINPPVMPLHLLAQQIMALALQQGGIGASSWRDWVGRMPGFAALEATDIEQVLHHMLATEILHSADGMLWFGRRGESRFGRRNFMELLSSFASAPLFSVLHGKQHLGAVDRASFSLGHDKPQILLLSGHSWLVNHIDWKERTVFVEPSRDEGKSRWLGSGQPLSFELCQATKRVLAGEELGCEMSQRAKIMLGEVRSDFGWIKRDETAIVSEGKKLRWWTFAGLLANSALTSMLSRLGLKVGRADNLAIAIEDRAAVANWDRVMEELREMPEDEIVTPVDAKTLEQLKFSECLPRNLAMKELEARMTDRNGAMHVANERVNVLSQ